MRAVGVAVGHVLAKHSVQLGRTRDDDVVGALPPKAADDPLDVGVLPGRARGTDHLFDAHRADTRDELAPVDGIPVAMQVARGGLVGERVEDLLPRPPGAGGVGDVASARCVVVRARGRRTRTANGTSPWAPRSSRSPRRGAGGCRGTCATSGMEAWNV